MKFGDYHQAFGKIQNANNYGGKKAHATRHKHVLVITVDKVPSN